MPTYQLQASSPEEAAMAFYENILLAWLVFFGSVLLGSGCVCANTRMP